MSLMNEILRVVLHMGVVINVGGGSLAVWVILVKAGQNYPKSPKIIPNWPKMAPK